MATADFERGQRIGRELGVRMMDPSSDTAEFRRGIAAGLEEAFARAGMGHAAAPPVVPESFRTGD